MAQADVELLPHCIDLTPDADVPASIRQVPAKWGVALLTGQNQIPLGLLCFKDLRQGLRHRLLETPDQTTSRRVNWRQVVRQVRWQLVDSDFEADWVYLQAATWFFPQTCQDMIRWGDAWFVHVDPDEPFPRYAKTTDLSARPGTLIGPFPDKSAAARLIELIEDAFDLCRYHHILIQSPHAKACAYKDMGKCPAPCDGSISIEQYRLLVELSVAALVDPRQTIEQQTVRMRQAAAELRFESATRIRTYIEQLGQLDQGPLRQARPISQFSFVTLQTGPRDKQVKVYLIERGQVRPVISLLGEPGELEEAFLTQQSHEVFPPLPVYRERGQERSAAPATAALIVRHLFPQRKSRANRGVFIPLGELNQESLLKAYQAVAGSRAVHQGADNPD